MMAGLILAAVNYDYESVRNHVPVDPPFAAVGATLFFFSDSILLPALVLKRQGKKCPLWKKVVILLTYYYAQHFIALSVTTPLSS